MNLMMNFANFSRNFQHKNINKACKWYTSTYDKPLLGGVLQEAYPLSDNLLESIDPSSFSCLFCTAFTFILSIGSCFIFTPLSSFFFVTTPSSDLRSTKTYACQLCHVHIYNNKILGNPLWMIMVIFFPAKTVTIQKHLRHVLT